MLRLGARRLEPFVRRGWRFGRVGLSTESPREVAENLLRTAVSGSRGKGGEESLKDVEGIEALIFRSDNRTRFLWGGVMLSLPMLYATGSAVLRLMGSTAAETHSWLFIGVMMGGSSLLVLLNARMARFHIREAWYVRGGSHVRLRTFRFPVGYGPSVTVPATMLEEAAKDKPDKFRFLSVKGTTGPLMAVARDAHVERQDLYDALFDGRPVDLANPNKTPEIDPSDWSHAYDENGNVYFFHKTTHETSWDAPPGYTGHEERN